MRLTWKDAIATSVVAGAGGLYAWHLAAPDTAFVGSARWMSLSLFALGVVACATGGSYSAAGRYASTMSYGAAAALALAIVGMVTGSAAVLALLAGVIGVMWLVTTGRHALGKYPPPAASLPNGSHEAIGREHARL